MQYNDQDGERDVLYFRPPTFEIPVGCLDRDDYLQQNVFVL